MKRSILRLKPLPLFQRPLDPIHAVIDPRHFYSVAEAASILGVSASTVLRWVHQGRIKSVSKEGGNKFTGESLHFFLREGQRDYHLKKMRNRAR